MNNETKQLKISVRQLVEYVYRSGHIVQGWQNPQGLVEGTKNHQRIQAQQEEHYIKEVQLQQKIELDEVSIELEGRCDGVILEDQVTIDEIKSVYKPLDTITPEDYPSYWAQLKCYGYLYCTMHGLTQITLQMTFVHIITGEVKKLKQTVSLDTLEPDIMDMLKKYLPFTLKRLNWPKERNASIQALSFPFPQYREGQRTLAKHVYHTIQEGKRCFAKAPTGIGKTISTLFPALKAMGEGLHNRIFFLTAKTVTRTVTEESLRTLANCGLKIKAVTITAKEKACLQEEMHCHPSVCPYAEGYYDRINMALYEILEQEQIMTREVIERYARQYQLCPFELSLDLALYADVIICDYNYVFDPRASLKRFGDELKRDAILLIDEAHNLIDRARTMFSAQLGKSPILEVQRYFKSKDITLYKSMKQLNDYFIQLRKQYLAEQQGLIKDIPIQLLEQVKESIFQLEHWLEQTARQEQGDAVIDLYYSLYHFSKIAKLYTDDFITCVQATKQEVSVELKCLDPAALLNLLTSKYKSSIFFSATLFPLNYYKTCLGGVEEDISLQLSSPFSPEHLEITIYPISTRYKDRERTTKLIAGLILKQLKNQKENVLLFTPSYSYLESIMPFLEVLEEEYTLLIQQTGMNEEERERFLSAFSIEREKPILGLTVMGGIFSEGIDLPGKRLSTVIIIGTGLPQVGFERELLRKHYQDSGKQGYDYAYLYPGMSRVLQAAGRLIRTETDQGRLILIDDRYLTPVYQRLLPQEWRHYKVEN